MSDLSSFPIALQTAAGAFFPLARDSVVLPGLATRVALPKASFGRTTHRTPYGHPWVDQPAAARVASASGVLELRTSGRTPTNAGNYADRWQRVIEGLHAGGRVYVGARYLSVVSVPERPEPTPGAAWLDWTFSVELEYLDDLWRLSDDDVRPTRYPVETAAGLYPLGMLEVTGEGAGYYTVSPLGGVEQASSSPRMLTSRSGQTYAIPTTRYEVSDD